MPLFSLTSLIILAASFAAWFIFALFTLKPSQNTIDKYRQIKGRITECWKDGMEDPDAEPDADYWIFYEYEWEGNTLKGEDMASEDEDRSAYVTGREIPVWVDQVKPANSMLHDPKDAPAFSEIFSGAFFFVVIVTWLIIVGVLTLAGFGR